jgi:uncharacterized protein (DUF934 family)
MNACGHHHVGHIGILGVDKNGEEFYQVPSAVFSDGRGYSHARVLRDTYGFAGELRAVGDVQRDQLFLMRRCGFDSFRIRTDRDATDALAGFGEFSGVYQSSTIDPHPPLLLREACGGA